ALVAIFRTTSLILPFPYSLSVIALLGLNPFFWDYKDKISSDVPFLCFCFTALWLLLECETHGWRDAGVAVAAGVGIYLAYAVRSAGGILVPVLVVSCLVRLRHIPRAAWMAIATSAVLITAHTLVALRDT